MNILCNSLQKKEKYFTITCMHKFFAQGITYNDFVSLDYPKSNNYVLESNLNCLNKIFSFLQSDESLLLVTGFTGTGKSDILNHVLNFIDRKIYSFRIYCNPAMTIDDVLLQLWSQFVLVASNDELSSKQVQTNSFQEKLMTCLANSFSDIVISFYDFDLITEENRADILSFITTFKGEKFKILISSKTFDTTLLPENIMYTKVIIKALSRVVFEKYLTTNGIKASQQMYNELYKHTRGYFFNTLISTKILQIKNLGVNDYLIAYANSCMSFDKFLAKAYISMLPQECFKVLNTMAICNHPINSQTLDYFDIYDDRALSELKDRNIVAFKDDYYILNSFFREEIYSLISDEEKDSIKNKLAEFYSAQLPLKPSERIILLSRISLRNESEYFKNIVSIQPEEVNDVVTVEEVSVELTIEQLYEKAFNAEKEYNYQEALTLYTQLLDKTNDKLFIYPKLTDIYTKLGNNKFALHYADYLVNYYKNNNESKNRFIFELKQAQIYYQTYKITQAIDILNGIVTSSQDVSILIDAYTHLANIYIGLSDRFKAKENYTKAIQLIQDCECGDFTELYFKYAIILDQDEEREEAFKYYQKCTESGKYVSSAFSNMGDYLLDIDKYNEAIECFRSAYSVDEKNANYYGMYYELSNLAKAYKKIGNEDEFCNSLVGAKKYAQESKDIFAIANSGLHLGDYYAKLKLYKQALEEYFIVLGFVKDKFKQENLQKIETRINNIKQIIGDGEFESISNIYCK